VRYGGWTEEIAPYVSEADEFWLRLSYEECALRLLTINHMKIAKKDGFERGFVMDTVWRQ